MSKGLLTAVVLGSFLALSAASRDGIAQRGSLRVSVRIAPQTMRLDADQGGEVTVHAGVPYVLVDELPPATFKLQGIPASATFADACGDLVCKFSEDDVKDLFGTDYPAFTRMFFRGITEAGVPFVGFDVVRLTAQNN